MRPKEVTGTHKRDWGDKELPVEGGKHEVLACHSKRKTSSRVHKIALPS